MYPPFAAGGCGCSGSLRLSGAGENRHRREFVGSVRTPNAVFDSELPLNGGRRRVADVPAILDPTVLMLTEPVKQAFQSSSAGVQMRSGLAPGDGDGEDE